MSPYSGPVIDSHHHLWDLATGDYPWLAPHRSDTGPLARDYLAADYLRDADGEGVVATVHVEAGHADHTDGRESAFVIGQRRAGVAAAHIARVDMTRPGAPDVLEREAADPGFRGIRQILSWHPDPARTFAPHDRIMADAGFRAGLGWLSARHYLFELMLFPWQMAEADALVADFPDLVFVLEHCGSPIDRSASGMALWRHGLETLAHRPNVVLKVSNPFAYDPAPTPDTLGIVIRTCFESFRPERCMYGSDAPVSLDRRSHHDILALYREVTADLPAAAQHAVFHDTARRVYRL